MRTEVFSLGADPAPKRSHPAKMNGQLALTLVEDYSRPGEVVLDPFAGSGTTGWAALQLGRRYVGVELEMGLIGKRCEGVASLCGDALCLPFRDESIDFILTSPPYGEAVGRAGDRSLDATIKAKERYEEKRFGRVVSTHAVYGRNEHNLGSMPLERKNAPCFVKTFIAVLAGLYRVLRGGGMAALVVRDQRRGRRKLGLFDLPGYTVQKGIEVGFVFVERRVAVVPPESWTLWQRVNANRWGHPIPNAEHVIVLRKA